MVAFAGEDRRSMKEVGKPPVMVKENAYCSECDRYHEFEKCPECGSWIEVWYGLMFGGFGLYKYCLNDSCDWYWQRLEGEEDE